ncbi:uncharacterized protein LOC134407563 isoform X1 [Elgaria multicarinata webbii]|uniref:uncharacterized protein LOC134407563 isoform X1 n=1 Tax=Elgaria multicarinata webbii TaxID=159646 RepID=UPI002FCD2AB8
MGWKDEKVLEGRSGDAEVEEEAELVEEEEAEPYLNLEEFKQILISNNEVLFEGLDRIHEEFINSLDDIINSMAKTEKDVKEVKTEVNQLSKQVDQHEQQLSDHNITFDFHEKRLIQLKDQNRRANIRIKNFPEMQGEDVRKIILRWFKELIPDFLITEMDVYRVHRVAGNRFRATPRDILVKFGNYYKKEQLMKKLRPLVMLKFQDSSVQIYNDLCQQTINWRRSVKPIIAKLKRVGVAYSWGYPVFLRFMRDGKQQRVTSLEQGLELLRSLGMDDDSTSQQAGGGGEGCSGASGK